MPAKISTCFTFESGYNTETRDIPELRFIEAYAAKVDSLNLSDNFDVWYGTLAIFENADGVIYNGGQQIWQWMHAIFAPFSAMKHIVHKVRFIKDGVLDEGVLIEMECTTQFWPKSLLKPASIDVRRFLSFVVAKAEPGKGTYGYWIVHAKAWWDTAVLARGLKNEGSNMP